MGCGAFAAPGKDAEKLKQEEQETELQRFEEALQAEDVPQVLQSTNRLNGNGAIFNRELWSSASESKKAGACLLLDAVLIGSCPNLGDRGMVDAAVFLDMDCRPSDTFDASQLNDNRMEELFNITALREFLAPDVSRRLQEALRDDLALQMCSCIRMLSADEINDAVSDSGAREKMILCLMKEVLCSKTSEKDREILDAAASFGHAAPADHEQLHPLISRLETNRIRELVNYPMCSAMLAMTICRRLASAVESGSLEETHELAELFKLAAPAADASTRQDAAFLLMRTALADVHPGDEDPELRKPQQIAFDAAVTTCFDEELFKSEMPDYIKVIEALLKGRWQISPSGDSTAGDWEDLPHEVAGIFERFHKVYLDADNNPAKLRMSQVQSMVVDDIPYTFDIQYLTLAIDGQVKPARRVDKEGQQTHPDPEQKHPWYNRRIELKEAVGGKGDWLTNEYFWSSFCEAMAASGHRVDSPVDEIFDFRFNQDFRAVKKDNKSDILNRGGEDYQIPCGWKKFAVRVKGKYDDGDDDWLGLDGSAGEWAIAYHGTKHNCLPGILENGLFVGPAQVWEKSDAIGGGKVGKGVYCSPNIDEVAALEVYAKPAKAGGHDVQFVMQCRVRPGAVKKVHEPSRTFGRGLKYDLIWVINDPKDIRPYAVLVRGRDSEWKPDAVDTFGNFTNQDPQVISS